MGGERQAGREGTGTRWGKRVCVFLANLVYKVKSVLYGLNLPATAHRPPYLPSPQVVVLETAPMQAAHTLLLVHARTHTHTNTQFDHEREIDILTVL